jgi:hypothetical protein
MIERLIELSGEPNNGPRWGSNDNCVALVFSRQAKWNDQHCSTVQRFSRGYVCASVRALADLHSS